MHCRAVHFIIDLNYGETVCPQVSIIIYTDRNLMVESTIFDGKPEPIGMSAS